MDPKTGNLAVAAFAPNDSGALVVYSKANRKWSTYPTGTRECHFATYDDKSDVFVVCERLRHLSFTAVKELLPGSSHMSTIHLKLSKSDALETLQWDVPYLTMELGKEPGVIYQVKVQGTTGTIVGHTTLESASGPLYWIQGSSAVAAYQTSRGAYASVGIWDYPQGGSPTEIISGIDKKGLWDLTVSVAPSASHSRK